MSLSMTRNEREAFLSGVHVGIVSIERAGGPPLTVPIWYDFDPSVGLWLITSRTSEKGRALDAAGRFSLCAQEESLPYRYVTVEGPVIDVRVSRLEEDLRPMARRYFGVELGDRYVASSGGSDDSAVYTMRPERWMTIDYGKSRDVPDELSS